MQRILLGLIAAALLLGALITFLTAPDLHVLAGGMLRVGLVLGIIWLAIPNVVMLAGRIPGWLVATTFVGILIILWQRHAIFVVGPILVALWVLGPRWFGKAKK